MPPDPTPNPAPDPNWMDPRDNAQRSHFHRHPSRRERDREETLRAWFGAALAPEEISAHQRGPQPAGAAVDAVLAKIRAAGPAPMLVSLQTEWPKLVGPDAAKRSRPASLQGVKLLIEVADSTWLYALERMHKAAILERVRTFTSGAVAEIRFQASGSRPPAPGGPGKPFPRAGAGK